MKKTVITFLSIYMLTVAILASVYTYLTPYYVSDWVFWTQSFAYIGAGVLVALAAIVFWLLPSIAARHTGNDYFGSILVVNIMSAPIAVMGLFTPAIASMIVFALALIVWTTALAWSVANCGYSEDEAWACELCIKSEAEEC